MGTKGTDAGTIVGISILHSESMTMLPHMFVADVTHKAWQRPFSLYAQDCHIRIPGLPHAETKRCGNGVEYYRHLDFFKVNDFDDLETRLCVAYVNIKILEA